MKKQTAIGLLAALVGAFLMMGLQHTETGDPISLFWPAQPQSDWRVVATITDVNESFGVDDRLYEDMSAVADPNFVIWAVPVGWRNVQFRFRTDADADADVVEVWMCAAANIRGTELSDSFGLGSTWTLTGGTQVGPNSDVYVDTISASDGLLTSTVTDSAADRLCLVTANLYGVGYLAFDVTTLQASTTLIIEARDR